MSHISGWDDNTFHDRESLSIRRMERLVRKEKDMREAVDNAIEVRRRQKIDLEFQKLHELVVLETLEQLEALEKPPSPKKSHSMMTKFTNAITTSALGWLSSKVSPSNTTSKDLDDTVSIDSIDTIDTQSTDATDATEGREVFYFVTID